LRSLKVSETNQRFGPEKTHRKPIILHILFVHIGLSTGACEQMKKHFFAGCAFMSSSEIKVLWMRRRDTANLPLIPPS
jgi:hypothetical protein